MVQPEDNRTSLGAIDFNDKRIVVDIDGTICRAGVEGTSYADAEPILDVIQQIRNYRNQGFTIVLYTSRQMRTHKSNLGKIIADTVPVLIEWLKRNDVPYDEIHVGKPWCGFGGFYVDDKTIRPSEFTGMSYAEVVKLLRVRGKDD